LHGLYFSAALPHSGTTIWESNSCVICRGFNGYIRSFSGQTAAHFSRIADPDYSLIGTFTVRGTVSEMKTPGLWSGFHRKPKFPASLFRAES
jgi:hypothetical protein